MGFVLLKKKKKQTTHKINPFIYTTVSGLDVMGKHKSNPHSGEGLQNV